MDDFKKYIKNIFIEDPQKGLDEVLGKIDRQTKWSDDFLLLKGRYNLINEQANKNIINRSDYEVEANKINYAFISLLNEIKDDEIFFSIGTKSSLLHFENENAAHDEIENQILRSNKIKLHLIRGEKLFKEKEGLFYLRKYNSLSQFLNLKVLFLDFETLTQEEYIHLNRSISLVWKGLNEDRESFIHTLDRLNQLNDDFDVKVKVYGFNHLHFLKLYIFDDSCYFTVYHKLGKTKEHQKYPVFKIDNSSPLYPIFEAIFDNSWEKSKILIN